MFPEFSDLFGIDMKEYPKGKKETWLNQAVLLIKEAESGKEDGLHSLLMWQQDMNWPGAN